MPVAKQDSILVRVSRAERAALEAPPGPPVSTWLRELGLEESRAGPRRARLPASWKKPGPADPGSMNERPTSWPMRRNTRAVGPGRGDDPGGGRRATSSLPACRRLQEGRRGPLPLLVFSGKASAVADLVEGTLAGVAALMSCPPRSSGRTDSTPLRIFLHSRAFLPNLGGVEQVSYMLARALSPPRGHKVIVATDVEAPPEFDRSLRLRRAARAVPCRTHSPGKDVQSRSRKRG